jgi:hypothetical protein
VVRMAWHARGQGFKSPQLHQAQRISTSPAQGRLPEICQSLTDRVGKNTMSADRVRYFGTHGASVVVRTFSTGPQGRPCGRPPAAAVLGRQHHDGFPGPTYRPSQTATTLSLRCALVNGNSKPQTSQIVRPRNYLHIVEVY